MSHVFPFFCSREQKTVSKNSCQTDPTSLSNGIIFGTLCSRTTAQKKRFATWVASRAFLHAIKCVILETLSTTTNTGAAPLVARGNPNIKSTLTSIQGAVGTGRGLYMPVFCFWPLETWHTRHLSTCLYTSRHKVGQKYLSETKFSVLFLPKCPPKPPPCNSPINSSFKEPSGMHNLTPLSR